MSKQKAKNHIKKYPNNNMMNTKKGITLIALVITIVVMTILAGISLNMTLGSNGIISKARLAVIEAKKAEVREDVETAWVKLAKAYLDDGAEDEVEFFTKDIINENLSSGRILKYSGYVPDGNTTFTYVSTSTYESFGVSVSSTGEVTVTDYSEATKFLADVTEIGDYVDIGIDYTNTTGFTKDSRIITDKALTGWRVLSIEGSGITGKVKLVSAGTPLSCYRRDTWNKTIISTLNDMYKTLNTNTDSISYFTKTGFKNDSNEPTYDMTEVFTYKNSIDTASGIHAFGVGSEFNGTNTDGEVETLYKAITGDTKTITELSHNYALGTTVMKSVVQSKGNTWNDKWNDLMSTGQRYCLGGTAYSTYHYWYTDISGYVHAQNLNSWGVRVVVTLDAGVQISNTNTGDGNSSDKAYTIK